MGYGLAIVVWLGLVATAVYAVQKPVIHRKPGTRDAADLVAWRSTDGLCLPLCACTGVCTAYASKSGCGHYRPVSQYADPIPACGAFHSSRAGGGSGGSGGRRK